MPANAGSAPHAAFLSQHKLKMFQSIGGGLQESGEFFLFLPAPDWVVRCISIRGELRERISS